MVTLILMFYFTPIDQNIISIYYQHKIEIFYVLFILSLQNLFLFDTLSISQFTIHILSAQQPWRASGYQVGWHLSRQNE